jgi:hypothetical protein
LLHVASADRLTGFKDGGWFAVGDNPPLVQETGTVAIFFDLARIVAGEKEGFAGIAKGLDAAEAFALQRTSRPPKSRPR